MAISFTLPLSMTASGAVPTDPSVIRQQVVSNATAMSPGLTANLPASLVEDMVSTITAAGTVCDQARAETINSLTPYGANAFLLNQQGAMLGIPQGLGSNPSAFVVFSGLPGYVIDNGFVVSDGSNQYVLQQSTIISSSGVSPLVYVLATQSGNWAIPANSITTVVTSVPTGYTLKVTNPAVGNSGTSPQTETSYRAQVLEAISATATGATSYVRTLINRGTGQVRLTSIKQVSTGWQIMAGAQDPYLSALAVLNGMFALTGIVGSQLSITAITKATAAVVTTNFNHGVTTGAVITINNVVGMTQINGLSGAVTVINTTQFSIAINSTAFSTYTSGGTISPNPREIDITVVQYPDTYVIPIVLPLQDSVAVQVTWNTNSPNFVSAAAIAQQGSLAVVAYVNSIPVGQPINVLEMQDAFQTGVASILPPQFLTRLLFTVIINGSVVSPAPGTGIVAGDPESYFMCPLGGVTVTQG